MTKLITRKTAITAIISLTVAYPTIAAVPNTFSAGQPASAADVNANFTNLDSRVGVLEAASTNPASVAVNCTADANALKNADLKEYTTYNITGACNGPIFVEEDHIHLLGSSNTTDSIVLPSGVNRSAIWAGGAYNLQITNLFLDLTATTTAFGTAGLWSRNSYVSFRDSRIQGGSSGISPSQGTTVFFYGTNSITEFANTGLSASEQSHITTRGPTTVSSTRTEDQYMKGIRASNGSSVDIREGITVSLPTGTNARAINVESNASVNIRNSGTVSLTGDIRSEQNSTVVIQKGTVTGNIDVRRSASLKMDNGVIITGDARVDESIWSMEGGSISGNLDIRRSSSVKMEEVTITGDARFDSASWYMEDGSISGTIEARKGGALTFYNVTQTSDDDEAIRLDSNATLSANGSNLGRAFANSNSSLQLSAYDENDISTMKGVELGLGSVANISNTSITANIEIFPSAVIALTNGSNLNGNNIYLCHTPSYVDSSVIGIGNSDIASACP